jgi:DNA-binding beta-propeller fold protein YncE
VLAVFIGYAVVILSISGCATKPTAAPAEVKDVVWPPPPAPAVIRYVQAIKSEADIGAVKEFDWKTTLLGEQDERVTALVTPYAVHMDKRGRLLVGDTKIRGLVVFDLQNKSVAVFGIDGPGAISQAVGVASDAAGNVYAADGLGQQVVVFDAEGNYLRRLGSKGDFARPVGIAVDDQRGRVYVADMLKHHVAVYGLDGERLSVIGEPGEAEGQFNRPLDLDTDSDGRLYVLDSMNFRVQVFDPDGNQLLSIGRQGTGGGQFARPKGLAVDSEGNVYVSDSAFNNVQIFNPAGELLLFFASAGNGPGRVQLPAGLSIDDKNRIYLADQYNGQIQVFEFLGKPDSDSDQD